MNNTFKYIKRSRELFLDLINELSVEQLNEIPAGFNNNIIWNFGHIMVSTIGLSYLRTGIRLEMEIPYQKLFGKGTRPEGLIDQAAIEQLKKMVLSSIDQIEEDANAGVFDRITPYSTATYGYEMRDFKEVLICALAHDNMHLGIAKAQSRLVTQHQGIHGDI